MLTRTTGALGAIVLLAAGLGLASGCDSHRGSAAPTASAAPTEARTVVESVDQLLAADWQVAGVTPAPAADDATFMRRAYLDLTGVVPSAMEARAFLADKRADKRERLLDTLLASEGYVRHWTNYWDEVLLPDSVKKRFVDRGAFRQWLHQEIQSGAGYDHMVREILTASGVNSEGGRRYEAAMEASDEKPAEGINGAVNWYLAGVQQPQNLAGSASRVFLGVQIQCAECHDHKTEKWTQDDFKHFTAAFMRVEGRPIDRGMKMGPVRFEVDDADAGARRQERRMKKRMQKTGYDDAKPRALDGTSLEGDNPREALASWITAKDNPWFAKAIVNRMWGHFLGTGFVEPVDDFRDGQTVASPAVLDALVKDFAASGYDLRHLMRTICSSQAYARAAHGPAPLWSSFAMRPMDDTQLLDSIVAATGIEPVLEEVAGDKLPRLELAMHKQFHFNFDVDEEAAADTFTGTVPQALMLLNGPLTAAGSSALEGSTLAAAREKKTEKATLEALYLATLSRKPTRDEIDHWQSYVNGAAKTRTPAVRGVSPVARLYRKKHLKDLTAEDGAHEDILWALLNSSEFFFIH